ncbi:MAG: GldG family protein [Candidatus Zixiibacteriota bacterium]
MKKNLTIIVIVVIGIFIFLNLLASQAFRRVDLTENNIYSLSDVSKNIAKELPDKVIIKAFFSEDLAAPYNNNASYTRDLLDEYRTYSNGNIEYEFINPDKDEETKNEAMQYGLQPVQIQAIERDEMSLKRVFMGLVFIYGDKTETIPVVQNVNELEYTISSNLKKLTAEQIPEVGYATGHGEPDLYSECQQIQQSLSGQYKLTPVQLPAQNGIPENIKTLVIVNPKRQVEEEALAQIDQFLMYGGRLALFIDNYEVEFETQNSTPLNTGLDKLLDKYGLELGKNVLADENSGQIAVSRQMGNFQMQVPMNYPFLPMINNLNDNHLITEDLENINLVFASSVSPNGKNENADFKWLLKSSENSQLMQEPFDLNPMSYENPSFAGGPFELAYSAKGSFKSYLGSGNVGNFQAARPVKVDSEPTKLTVVGDGDFIVDKYLRNQENLVFFQNVVDWLTSEEGKGLISIRSREVTVRPLEEVESYGMRTFIKYLNILLPPFIIIIYGIIRWRIRKRRRKMSMEM